MSVPERFARVMVIIFFYIPIGGAVDLSFRFVWYAGRGIFSAWRWLFVIPSLEASRAVFHWFEHYFAHIVGEAMIEHHRSVVRSRYEMMHEIIPEELRGEPVKISAMRLKRRWKTPSEKKMYRRTVRTCRKFPWNSEEDS
jgi:hypothetical protein